MSELSSNFIQHLIELRDRLVRALAVVVVCFIGLMPFATDIYDFLAAPLLSVLPVGSKMIAIGVITPFFIPVKITLLVAFMVSLPWVLYQLWAFISPALYQHERRLILPLVFSSTILFFAGIAFCYYFVFATVFRFIAGFSGNSITFAPDIESYFNFVLTMFLAFGVAFEVPIAIAILVLSGIVNTTKLRQIRPYMIVGAFVVAAVVTPPDVISQLLLAIPLVILYEIGIIFAPLLQRYAKKKPDETSNAE